MRPISSAVRPSAPCSAEHVILELDRRVGQILPQRMVEHRGALEHAAGEEELGIERLLAGRGDVRPEREQLEAALLADPHLLIQRLEVRQVDQRGLERLLGKVGRVLVKRRRLRNEGGQRPVGLLDAPAQLAPQPHEEVDAQKVDRFGFGAVGVLQRGQVEIASGIGIGQHQNLTEGKVFEEGL